MLTQCSSSHPRHGCNFLAKFLLSNLEHCYVRINGVGNNRTYFKASRNNEVLRFVDTIIVRMTLLFKSYNTLHECKNILGHYVSIVPWRWMLWKPRHILSLNMVCKVLMCFLWYGLNKCYVYMVHDGWRMTMEWWCISKVSGLYLIRYLFWSNIFTWGTLHLDHSHALKQAFLAHEWSMFQLTWNK